MYTPLPLLVLASAVFGQSGRPAAPANLQAIASAPDRLELRWQDRATNETRYRLERSLVSGTSGFAAIAPNLPANSTFYLDTGLQTGAVYWYRVAAENAAGSSDWSNTAHAPTAVTTVSLTGESLRTGVRRLGMNLGHPTYWDSGLITRNLLFRNPGFEGLLYRSVVRCTSLQATSWGHGYTDWTAGFWNGGTFDVITGTGAGRSGTISQYTRVGTDGFFTPAAPGLLPGAAGDYVVVAKSFPGGALSGWWSNLSGAGAITTETADLPPGTAGLQAVRLSAPGANDAAKLVSYSDGDVLSFLQISGTWRLRFKAKGIGPQSSVGLLVQRLGTSPRVHLSRVEPLTSGWRSYEVLFNGDEAGNAVGIIKVEFAPVPGSTMLLDDVSLDRPQEDATNPTVFREEVVTALRELRPGVLRYFGNQHGDTLDNQIAPEFGRRRPWHSLWVFDGEQIEYGLHDFLVLAETLGCEPWYSIPITFSLQEVRNLMEYLGGDASTPYGAKRAARGHPQPWTATFPRIHLELGSESWNDYAYGGGTIGIPEAYGARGHAVFAAARQSPFYSGRFNLLLNGQAVWVGRSQAIHQSSQTHDSFAVAPYLQYQINDYATNEQFYAPLFAESELQSRAGVTCSPGFYCNFMRLNYEMLQGSSRPAELAVYETNVHTTDGSITRDQAALDRFFPSHGIGLAVANNMLQYLRELGVRIQAFYSLHQYAFTLSATNNIKLFGSIRDCGVQNLRRPQFQALRVVNDAIKGQLNRTIHLGPDPTWNQAPSNGTELMGAHYLHSYAFTEGSERSLVLFNLSRANSLAVAFTGPDAPRGLVRIQILSAAVPTAKNESAAEVVPATITVPFFEPTGTLPLEPCSITVLSWRADQTPPEGRSLLVPLIAPLGSVLPMLLCEPDHPSAGYVLALSMGRQGFPIPRGFRFPLSLDEMFVASVTPPYLGLAGGQGFFAAGRAGAQLPIPFDPLFDGLVINAAFLTFDPFRGIPLAVSDATQFQLTR
jgi:hypothetical protein